MLVFVTGGSGLVGSAVIPALRAARHTVTALARSDKSAETVTASGASKVWRGDVTDLEVLKQAATEADAVIHLGYSHELAFSGKLIEASELDRAAIAAMCDALVESSKDGKKKVFLGTSGTFAVEGEDEKSPGRVNPANPRYLSDLLVASYAERDLLRTHYVRLSPVTHGPGREHPFITAQIKAAKQHGEAAHIEGLGIWNAVHVTDAAQIYVLALEGKAPNGAALHAVKDEKIPVADIAAFIGKKLDLPTRAITKEQAMKRFGFVGMAMAMGGRKTANFTKEWLGWKPTGPSLFDEMDTSFTW